MKVLGVYPAPGACLLLFVLYSSMPCSRSDSLPQAHL